MKTSGIDYFASVVPSHLWNVSGSVFYSGRSAFSAPSPLYLLGLNPGGSPIEQAEQTLRWHTDRVQSKYPKGWSAYRDESWKGHAPGTFGMQPRVLHLMAQLGLDPGDTPSSNLVFKRTSGEADLTDFEELAATCWPFHEQVIERLGIRLVVCFGQKAGGFVRRQLNCAPTGTVFRESYARRRWPTTCHRASGGIRVVTATHPSRSAWTAREADPSDFIRQSLNEVLGEAAGN